MRNRERNRERERDKESEKDGKREGESEKVRERKKGRMRGRERKIGKRRELAINGYILNKRGKTSFCANNVSRRK